MNSRDAAADGGSDDAKLGHELRKGRRLERLRAVGERPVRIVVDFDQQAVGTGSDGGAGHGRNLIAAAGGVRRVADDGQVRELLDDGNGGEIEGVACVGFKRADAAFAKNDVVISARKNVFGAEQQLFHSGGKAAFQEHGLADFAEGAKQIVVLHVARTHLEQVHVRQHHRNLGRIHNFADGAKAEFVGGFTQELEAGLAQALKRVRRSARFEGAAAKNLCAGFGDAFGDAENLLTGFDRTGTGGDDYFRAADFDTTAKVDDGAFGPELAAGKFEGLRDAHDFAHAFEQFEVAMIEVAVHADSTKNGMRFTGRAVHVEAAGDQAVDDVLDLGLGGPFLHHNDHRDFCFLSSVHAKSEMLNRR